MKDFGILCHVSSLPNEFGIGDFGKSAFEFVDFLKAQKINIWQILPLNIANDFNCPYGAMSFLTIDTMFVDVEALVREEMLEKRDLCGLKKHKNDKRIDFEFVRAEKKRLLEKAYLAKGKAFAGELTKFSKQRKDIFDFAVYETLRKKFDVEDWRKIPTKLWELERKECKKFVSEHHDEIFSIIFQQYILISQWKKLREYANKQGISILGDTPIYCERNSFEVFRNPEYFKLDKDLMPKVTGGCPPDIFSAEGQDWGTCIYNWSEMKKDGYAWWKYRLKVLLQYFDVVRLDHFIGYVEHFENNVKDKKKSKWVKEAGEEFFNCIKKSVNFKRLVVEDLGIVTKETKRVKELFDFKGMNILQFAFSGDETNEYLPKNVTKNSIYYLGTHDNNTFLGFLNSLDKEEISKVSAMLGTSEKNNKHLLAIAVDKMFESKSETIILQAQDFLLQDEKERTNVPGRAEDCWNYRMPRNYQKRISKNMKMFDRK